MRRYDALVGGELQFPEETSGGVIKRGTDRHKAKRGVSVGTGVRNMQASWEIPRFVSSNFGTSQLLGAL